MKTLNKNYPKVLPKVNEKIGNGLSDSGLRVEDFDPLLYIDFTRGDIDPVIGIGLGTFTADRETATNFATKINQSKLVSDVVTDDEERFVYGHYAEDGFSGGRGIMLEKADTNLEVDIEDYSFGNGWFNYGSPLITSGKEDPKGQFNASSVKGPVAFGFVAKTYAPITAGERYYFSVWVKVLSGTVWISLTDNGTGTKQSYKIEHNSYSGWRKYTFYYDVTATATALLVDLWDSASGSNGEICVWGASLTRYRTSTIPSAGSAMTRNIEFLKYNLNGNFNGVEGSIALAFRPIDLPAEQETDYPSLVHLNNGIGERASFRYAEIINDDLMFYREGGDSARGSSGIVDPHGLHTIIGTYKNGELYKVYLDGALLGTSSANWVTLDTSAGDIFINGTGSGAHVNITAKAFATFNEILTSQEVASLDMALRG